MEISLFRRCQNIFKTLFSKISLFGITIFGIKVGLTGHPDTDLNMFWDLAHRENSLSQPHSNSIQ
jgi:hypothetical protein